MDTDPNTWTNPYAYEIFLMRAMHYATGMLLWQLKTEDRGERKSYRWEA